MSQGPRSGLSALAAVIAVVLLFALLVTCQGGEDLTAPPEDISGELSEKPVAEPQAKIKIAADAPALYLGGLASSESAAEVWRLTQRLARNWTFHPDLVLKHDVEVDELDGVTKMMTEEAGKRWRKQARRALEPWVDRFRTIDARPAAQARIYQLVQWNMFPPRYRGWDNPMYGPARADGVVIAATAKLGVIMRIRTSFSFKGQGKQYRVPYTTTLFILWDNVGGTWKIEDWQRAARRGTEIEVGTDETIEPSDLPTEDLSPDPILGGDVTPGTVFPS